VVRINGSGPYLNRAAWETHTWTGGRGITVNDDGVVWAAAENVLVSIDPVTLDVAKYLIPGPGYLAFSAAPDAAHRIWVVSWPGNVNDDSGWAYRFDPDTQTFDVFDLGGHTYARSDLTGARLRRRVARQGSWTQVVDSGYATTEWRTLDWAQSRPSDSSIEAYVRFASTRAGLDSTSLVCGPYLSPPVDLRTCPGDEPTRFATINFLLRPSRSGQLPSVAIPRLSWTRP
jgi:hypothetical protein